MNDAQLKLLDQLAKLCQERAAIAERMYREVLAPFDTLIEEFRAALRVPDPPAVPKPSEQEQEILALWDELEDGTKLTTSTVAKLSGNYGDNGTLKRRLAEMVRRGLLNNDGCGYYPATATN